MIKLFKRICAAVLISCTVFTAGCGVALETIGKGESSAESETETENSKPAPEGTMTAEVSEYVYHIPERYYSDGIKNIVRRARQIYEMRWMPLTDLTGFNGDYVFKAGDEVRGIPYGQPVYSGSFVGFEATIEQFLSESKDKNGLFYTEVSEYEELSTYYSLDCTSLVCYAWNTAVRMDTSILVQFGDNIGNNVNNLQVGDALIRTGDNAHAVLITGIIEDENNNVIWVEVTEQTPPLTKQTRYGEGELYELDEFVKWYLDDGYYIYRNTDYRDSTPYTHSCAVPLDGERCASCGDTVPFKSVSAEVSGNNVNISCVFASNEKTESLSYVITPYFYGLEKYKTRDDSSLRLRTEPVDGETLDYIDPGTVLTVMDVYTDTNGERWGKLRYNGHCGWIWLEGSTLIAGSLDNYEKINVPAGSCGDEKVEGYGNDGMTADFTIPRSDFHENSWVTIYAKSASGYTYEVGTAYVRFGG